MNIKSTPAAVPDWANKAMESFAPIPGCNCEKPDETASKLHFAFCATLKSRWLELDRELLPDLKCLTDVGKQLVLEQAIYAAKYQSNSDLKKLREAKDELSRLNSKIQDKAIELCELLDLREQLQFDFAISDGVPSLFESIERAAERYPEWNSVSSNEIRAFMSTRTQSRPKPSMNDLLACFAMGITDEVASPDDPLIFSQKSQAGRIRAVLFGTRSLARKSLDEHGITSAFRLSDAAIAALVNVVYDLADDDLVNANAVKSRRQEANKKTGYDFG